VTPRLGGGLPGVRFRAVTDEPEPRERQDPTVSFEEAVAIRDEIYRLRGRIMSDVSAVEGSVELALACYFVSAERSQSFYLLIAVRLSLADKLEILSKIVEALGLKSRVAQTVSRLERANAIRNEQAHSNVMVFPAPTRGGLTFELQSLHKTKRGGLRLARIATEELAQCAAWIDGLPKEVYRITNAIAAAATGKDPLAEMDAFDAANKATD